MCVCCSPVLFSSVVVPSCLQIEYQHLRWSEGEEGRGGGGGGRMGEQGRRRRSEGGIGKQERRRGGEQEGRKKRKESGKRSRKTGGRRRKDRRGRWGRECEREGEYYICTPATCTAVFTYKGGSGLTIIPHNVTTLSGLLCGLALGNQ